MSQESREIPEPASASPSAPAKAEVTVPHAFASLWAIATLFHLAHDGNLASSIPNAALSTVAIALLLRPSSVHRFLLFAVVQLSQAWYVMPRLSNHWTFSFICAVTFVFAAGYVAVTRGKKAVTHEALFDVYAPPIRVAVLVLYFYVVFHKLNADFFNPAISCGAELYFSLREWLPFMPGGTTVVYVNAFATVIIEAIIPTCLVIPRARYFGIMLAACFHGVLGVRFFYDFSSMIFALITLYAPRDFSLGWPGKTPLPASAQSTLSTLGKYVFPIAIAGVGLERWAHKPGADASHWVAQGAWWLYAPVVIAIFFARAKRPVETLTPAWPTLSARPAAFWLMPALVLFDGFCPYLGLKTETSFAMFSNLRTEGGKSNHYIVPAGLDLAGYQKDLVRVETSSKVLQAAGIRPGSMFTYFTFRALLSEAHSLGMKDLAVTYERGGQMHTVNGPGDDPELFTKWPTLLYKLLIFRNMPPTGGPNVCRH